jgi:hypothetical protein
MIKCSVVKRLIIQFLLFFKFYIFSCINGSYHFFMGTEDSSYL